MGNRIEMTLATNLEFTKNEVRELEKICSDSFEIKTSKYSTKSVSPHEAVDFIFRNLDIIQIIRNGLLFTSFKETVIWLWQFAKKKRPNQKVSGWVNSNSINIILPDQDLDKALEQLPKILKTLEAQEGKIYWIMFENGTWTLQIFN